MNDPSAYQPDQHGVYRPGNPLLEALLAGEYRAGLEVFQALERPSAEDCCWAGQCLFGLDQSLEGYELTLQACSMGLEDAGAFAATILRFTGELDRADVLLESLDSGKLSALGLAVQARERGMIAFARGARREAVTHLEQAWDLATTHPIGVALLAHFSTMLALALAKVGRDALAAKHLERALGKAKP